MKFQTFDLDEMTLDINKNEFKIKNNFKTRVGTIEHCTVFIKICSFKALKSF